MGTRGGEGRPRRARRAAHHHRQTSPARFGALPRSGAGRPLPPLPPPNLNSPPALPPHRDMTHAAREALVTDFGLIGLESRGSGGDLARAAAASNAPLPHRGHPRASEGILIPVPGTLPEE